MTSHHRPGGGFRNPWPASAPAGFRAFLKWVVVDRLTQRRPLDPGLPPFTPRSPAFARRPTIDDVTVTWVGHASFLLQVGGLNILTDPMWSERASPFQFVGPRRRRPPGLALEALPPIDLVLQSHDHYDHLDERSVRSLVARCPEARWIAPLGVARWLTEWGVRRVRELDWWNAATEQGVVVTGTPAQHFSGRGFRDRDRALWCGWAIRAGSRAIWFAGDTGYHPEFAAISSRCGPFDLVLLPVGAYEPRWFMQSVHMNPDDAVRAYRDLGTSAPMVPMHWGTFKLTDEPMAEPPRRTAEVWRDAGLAPEALWILEPGETRAIPPVFPD